jgi:Ca2+/H+ antiporter
MLVTTLLAFVVANFLNKAGHAQAFATGVDWRMLPAGVLILLAVWVLAALALACSTRLEMVSTLAVCSALFLLGLMAPFWAKQGVWVGTVLNSLLPNWQVFWLADAMEGEQIQAIAGAWSYVGKAFAYCLCYSGALIMVALTLFEDRELG